jgi:hypothetical protein
MKPQILKHKAIKWAVLAMLGSLGVARYTPAQESLLSKEERTPLAQNSAVAKTADAPKNEQNLGQNITESGVKMVLKNTQFNFVDNLGFFVSDMNAGLYTTDGSSMVNFDDPKQWGLDIYTGSVLVKPEALTTLFNRKILAYNGAQMKDVIVDCADGELVIKGQVKQFGMWLPLSMTGTLALTDAFTMEMTPTSMKVLGLPLKSAMGLVGLKMGDMVDLNNSGATLKGNAIVMKLFEMFPSPAFRGKPQSAQVTKNGLLLTFGGREPAAVTPPADGKSYIWLQGGQVKFFNMTIGDSYLLMKPKVDTKMVDFTLYNYRRAVAQKGAIQMQADGGVHLTLSD